jgi:N-acetylmuramoyl-L-alanine amidase
MTFRARPRLFSLVLVAGVLSAVVLCIPADDLTLDFVFPEGDSADTVRVDHSQRNLRFSGHTDPEASLTLGGDDVEVWRTGAFAGLFRDLHVGDNAFRFEARRADERARRTLHVIREAPPAPLPRFPARVIPESIEPVGRTILAPGDRLRVSFRGSPGGAASATLGSSVRLRLTEDPADQGLYVGYHRVGAEDRWDDDEITLRLSVERGDPRHVEVTVRHGLWTLDPDNPPVLEVDSDGRGYAPLYTDPSQAVPLTDLPNGTRLTAWGLLGRQWKIRLAPGLFAWLPANGDQERFARELPGGTSLPRGSIRGVRHAEAADGAHISINLSSRLPFKVEEHTDSPALDVTLFGVRGEPPPGDGGMPRTLRWEDRGDQRLALHIPLRGGLWGWDALWEGTTLRLHIRRGPDFPSPPASALQGLRVILDAGHGGSDAGAKGSTGLMEKNVTLELAREVAALLESHGARVQMLRDRDEFVDLNRRIREAVASDADVLVSIHANAVPDDTDPLGVRGFEGYYDRAQADGLIRTLSRCVTAMPGVQARGVIERDLRLCRIHHMPSVLLECLYVTNPGDEAHLLDADFREHFAQAVVTGLEDWADARRAAHAR